MSSQFYPLKIKSIIEETTDAKTIVFDIPTDAKDKFSYKQGQYLTLCFNIKQQEVRRAYSMCSSPLETDIAVTVKRVEGGLVSNHINSNLSVGDTVNVMPPEGRFFTKLDPEGNKTYYLFASGSGITPIYSILKTIIEEEPKSTVFLLYGNRDEDSIIYKKSMDALASRYSGQLVIEHILSQPKAVKGKGLFASFKKGTINWQGKVGRIDENSVLKFLEDNPLRSKEAEYFICGPGGMIDATEKALWSNDVAKKSIHAERFTNTVDEKDKVAGIDGAKVIVTLDGEEITIQVPENKTILDVMIEGKLNAPYSCTSGSCSTCMAKVTKGEVKMDACFALDDDEVEEGYILSCQAHPTSAEVELTFDV